MCAYVLDPPPQPQDQVNGANGRSSWVSLSRCLSEGRWLEPMPIKATDLSEASRKKLNENKGLERRP